MELKIVIVYRWGDLALLKGNYQTKKKWEEATHLIKVIEGRQK
jgi:hypothetical protein